MGTALLSSMISLSFRWAFLLVLFGVLPGHSAVAGGSCRALFAVESGALGLDSADATAARVNGFSRADKDAWIDRLLVEYRALSKRSDGMFAPRRLADRLLSLTLRGDLMILEKMRGGSSAREAFAFYFDRVARARNAGYTAGQVFEALEVIRKILASTPLVDERSHILAGGSFFNGKADLAKSDVDVLGGHRDWIFGFANPEHTRELNGIFQRVGLNAQLKFEFHRNAGDHFLALNQPVVFRVFPNRIEMLVYPPAENRNGSYSARSLGPSVIPLD